MNERAILFSAPMVRAILAGTKTQTRRVVKLRTSDGRCATDCTGVEPEKAWADPGLGDGGYLHVPCRDGAAQRVRCPYGDVGDRLWVREAFRLRADQDDVRPSEDWWKAGAWYGADGVEPSGCGGGAGKLRPGIFMPRWASRLTLEVTAVRVQRLQEISEEDALAEGFVCGKATGRVALSRGSFHLGPTWASALEAFCELWDDTNAKRAPWAGNPWVWALTFRRVEAA